MEGEAIRTGVSLGGSLVVSVVPMKNKPEKRILSDMEKAKSSKNKLACPRVPARSGCRFEDLIKKWAAGEGRRGVWWLWVRAAHKCFFHV